MLELNGLIKTFYGVKAVHNVSLRIEASEVRGVARIKVTKLIVSYF